MLRIALFLLPFAIGAWLGVWMVSRGGYRRYWSLLLVSAAVGTFPALRLIDRVIGTRVGETMSARLSQTLGCAELGCGFVGGVFYAIAVTGLIFAAGLLAGGAFARGSERSGTA